MKKYRTLIIFLSGMCTGVAGGILGVYKHFKNKSQEEIESARESIAEVLFKETSDKVSKAFFETAESIKKEESQTEYKEKVSDLDYGNVESESMPVHKMPRTPTPYSDIYTITPDDYYYDRENEKEELIYYEEENVLADGDDAEVNIEESITTENLLKFGEYEEDVLYVRNERLSIDFCVTRTTEHYVNPGEYEPDNDYE